MDHNQNYLTRLAEYKCTEMASGESLLALEREDIYSSCSTEMSVCIQRTNNQSSITCNTQLHTASIQYVLSAQSCFNLATLLQLHPSCTCNIYRQTSQNAVRSSLQGGRWTVLKYPSSKFAISWKSFGILS